MGYTILKVTDGDDVTFFRCDLSEASSPLQYWASDEWSGEWRSTQYQCANFRHRKELMVEQCRCICAGWAEMPEDGYTIEHEVVDTFGYTVADAGSSDDCGTFAAAVERIAEWYEDVDSWSTGNVDDEVHAAVADAIESVERPEEGGVDELQDYAESIRMAVAEAMGARDFAGHGNYSVSAADQLGLSLAVTEIDHP